MEVLTNGTLWGALGAIIVANILLSGDNAIVIAMAARQLPPAQAKKAVFWGSAAAIVMRVILTIVAVELLKLPYLKIVGAILLVWIGVQLLMSGEESDSDIKAHGSMGAAIRTILIADLVMSVDNVIAVAGAADKAPEAYRVPLLIIGLALSIPLIIVGSTLLMKIMDRYPIIITAGAALLGFLAGGMIATDPAIVKWMNVNVPNAEYYLGALFALIVVVIGTVLSKRKPAVEKDG